MSKEVISGLEIHQQLDTKKLFCSCDSELVEEVQEEFVRRLRPAKSELGKVDRAAMMEAEKQLKFRYQAPPRSSCLVEADEEPPHAADEEAIQTTLTIARMLNADVVDEIHFMRKIVIDGSNTTGFQRTALVAMHGELELDGKVISMPTICLEEDAARKVDVTGDEVTYRLDRLGIPLVEIATGPELNSPEEVKAVAQALGSLMRATRRVKRGLGTIREDLNVSIPRGARVEIKGVQELNMLPVYVEKEQERQQSLLNIRDILVERDVEEIEQEIVDVTSSFEETDSGIIKSSLDTGGRVLVLPLPGFEGVMKSDDGKMRLGAELAQRARVKGVKGIFHTDELPGYGISEGEVQEIGSRIGMEGPVFALCAANEDKARSALEAVRERANEAIVGVPEETRDPQADGTTVYSRPLPGAERMYPETDVPPITVADERLKAIDSSLPELPRGKVKRLVTAYDIHQQQADQMVREGTDEIFEKIASHYGEGTVISSAASTVTSTFSEMEREGQDPWSIDEDTVLDVFRRLSEGDFAKEALSDIFEMVGRGRNVDEALGELDIVGLDTDDAEGIISSIVEERSDFVKERGMDALGPLMGVVMEELRGKIDGQEASEMLRKHISRILE